MILHIKVKPNSKQDLIKQEADGSLKVYVKAEPVDGKANEYLVKFIAEVLGLPKSKVTLLKGETSQFKKLEIDADEVFIKNMIAGILQKA
jgi:uncharacterized protein (TIGR00251 family)